MEKILISAEHRFIINALCDFVNKRESEIPNGLDWSCVLRASKEHELSAIIYYQVKKSEKVNGDALLSLKAAYSACIFYYSNRMSVRKKTEKSMTEADIPFIEFKGLEIADKYPVSALRTMGDCDILVKPDDKEAAHKIFLSLGMNNTHKGPNEWIYEYKGIEYELHHRMMNDEVGICDSHKRFMESHWEYAEKIGNSTKYRLDWSFHFVFLILHLRKHLIDSGIGFRQFMDLAVIANSVELDWDWIKAELEEMKLTRFSETVFFLCEKWFSVSMPSGDKEFEHFFADEIAEEIFKNGVFGFHNEENFDNYRILQIHNNKNRTSKLKIAVDNFFPPYSAMCDIPHYSFIKGRKYLLPTAWLLRFARALFMGDAVKAASTATKILSVSDEKIEKRMKQLEKWGL